MDRSLTRWSGRSSDVSGSQLSLCSTYSETDSVCEPDQADELTKFAIQDNCILSFNCLQEWSVMQCGEPIRNDCQALRSFVLSIHLLLQHKLKKKKQCYLPLVRVISHKDVVSSLENLNLVNTHSGKCLAWLLQNLEEGTLACYLESLAQHSRALAKLYKPDAAIRDTDLRFSLTSLYTALDELHFDLMIDSHWLDHGEICDVNNMSRRLSILPEDVDMDSLYESEHPEFNFKEQLDLTFEKFASPQRTPNRHRRKKRGGHSRSVNGSVSSLAVVPEMPVITAEEAQVSDSRDMLTSIIGELSKQTELSAVSMDRLVNRSMNPEDSVPALDEILARSDVLAVPHSSSTHEPSFTSHSLTGSAPKSFRSSNSSLRSSSIPKEEGVFGSNSNLDTQSRSSRNNSSEGGGGAADNHFDESEHTCSPGEVTPPRIAPVYCLENAAVAPAEESVASEETEPVDYLRGRSEAVVEGLEGSQEFDLCASELSGVSAAKVSNSKESHRNEINPDHLMQLNIQMEVFQHGSSEQLIKLFRVAYRHMSGKFRDVDLLISNRAIYILKWSSEKRYEPMYHFLVSEINFFSVYPDLQGVKIVGSGRGAPSFWVETGDRALTRLIVQAIQTLLSGYCGQQPPSIAYDATMEKLQLRKFVAKCLDLEDTPELRRFALVFYSQLSGKSVLESSSEEMAGQLEVLQTSAGHRLGRRLLGERWHPYYFHLSDFVLHRAAAHGGNSQPLLKISDCLECKRCVSESREFTLRVSTTSDVLVLAAQSERDAEEWTSAILHAIATCDDRGGSQQKRQERLDARPSSLVLTDQHLVLCKYDQSEDSFLQLSPALVLSDVSSLAHHADCCILDLEGRKQSDSSEEGSEFEVIEKPSVASLALFFSTDQEARAFTTSFQQIVPHSKSIPMTDCHSEIISKVESTSKFIDRKYRRIPST